MNEAVSVPAALAACAAEEGDLDGCEVVRFYGLAVVRLCGCAVLRSYVYEFLRLYYKIL